MGPDYLRCEEKMFPKLSHMDVVYAGFFVHASSEGLVEGKLKEH